jgi:hypothetical protein
MHFMCATVQKARARVSYKDDALTLNPINLEASPGGSQQ